MQSNKSCPIIEQYLAYLITVKGRSPNTISEYRLDLLQFFCYIADSRGYTHSDFSFADLDFIRSIRLGDMYAFLAYCQETLNAAPGTRYRKIVSMRQFWKYLKTKVHLIDNNIAEELETPKLPKRNVRTLTLEESVRLLIQAKSCSARDDCIITIFLNCALRLSELASLNIAQVDSDVISIIGKGNKERKIYLTPAVKQSLSKWLAIRSTLKIDCNALFISNFRSSNAFMSKDLLKRSNIYMPILVHECSCNVTKLMRGQAFWINTSANDMLFNDVLYGTCCKPASVPIHMWMTASCKPL